MYPSPLIANQGFDMLFGLYETSSVKLSLGLHPCNCTHYRFFRCRNTCVGCRNDVGNKKKTRYRQFLQLISVRTGSIRSYRLMENYLRLDFFFQSFPKSSLPLPERYNTSASSSFLAISEENVSCLSIEIKTCFPDF